MERIPASGMVVAGALAAVAILWLALFQLFRFQESGAIAASASTSVNLAHTYSGHVLDVVSNVDLHSRILADEIARSSAARVDLDGYRRKIAGAMPYATELCILDASGLMVQASPARERRSGAGTESFLAQRDAGSAALHISRPVRDAATGAWRIEMSRRLATSQGAFAGVLVFKVDPGYFSRFFAAAPVGANGVTQILRSDGIVLAIRAGQRPGIGTDISKRSAYAAMQGRRAGFFVSGGQLDGIRRILAFDKLEGYPLVVMLGSSLDDVLAPTRNRRPGYYAAATAVSALLLAAAALVAWLTRMQKETNRELAASQSSAEALLVENRRALQALQASEERWKFALEGAGDGVWDWNVRTGVAYFSRHWKEMFGYSESEVGSDIGEWERRVHPEDKARTLATVKAHLEGESRSYTSEHRMLCRDGSWKWVLDRGMVVSRDADGRPLRMIGTLADVTDRRRAEDGLRTLSRAVEQSPVSIVITDKAGNIEYVNPRFETVTGYGRAEAIGRNPRILKSGRTPPEVYERLWKTIVGGGTWYGELCNRKKNGDVYWEQAAISGLVDEAGKLAHFVAVKEDITERKHMEAEVRALNATLERRVAERTAELERANQELDAFTYSISHDLRSPVRSLNGFSHLLKEGESAGLSEQGQELLGRIIRNSRRMGDMIDDLLRLSRVGRGGLTLRQVDLDALVADVVAEIGETYRGTQVQLAALPAAHCDSGLVRQVYENLIGNAHKFSAKRAAPRVEIGVCSEAGETAYYVRDNGVGFDARYADRLFGVFQRLHSESEFPGTGAGLAIVKRIVERHGGRVWAESAPDAGTTFYFTLGKAG